MATLKPKRGKKESIASEKCKELVKYLFNITKDPRRFPKRYKDSFTTEMETLGIRALSELRFCDQFFTEDWSLEQIADRIMHEKKAVACLSSLDTLFCLAYELNGIFEIGDKTIATFASILSETLALSIRRQKADLKKYAEKCKGK